MKSNTAKKVVAIFSIVFGALAIFGSLDSEDPLPSLLLSVAIIVVGILLLIPALKKAEKGLMITGLVFYSLFIFVGVIVLTVQPTLGLIFIMMFGAPFAFSIVYLVRLNKERTLLREKERADAAAKLVAEQQEVSLAAKRVLEVNESDNGPVED